MLTPSPAPGQLGVEGIKAKIELPKPDGDDHVSSCMVHACQRDRARRKAREKAKFSRSPGELHVFGQRNSA